MYEFTGILLLLAVGWLWLDSARARELAVGIARAACDRDGLQLLDETVAQNGLRIRWTDDGIRLRRRFRFEFSIEGTARHPGQIILLGTQLESIELQRPSSPGPAFEPPQPQAPSCAPPDVPQRPGNVVPLRRPRN